MKYINQIQKIEAQTYPYIDEKEVYKVKLEIGLSEIELQQFIKRVPYHKIPSEFENLLKYTKGIDSPTGILDEFRFNQIEKFFDQGLLGSVINFGGDGLGGYWVQEIKTNKTFGKILFVGHDPPVLIKQANNLEEFLDQYYHFLLDSENSFIRKLYNEIAFQIYEEKGILMEQIDALKSKDPEIKKFANRFDKEWYIVDLRNVKNGVGFRLESNPIRFKEEEVWAMKKYKRKESWILKFIKKYVTKKSSSNWSTLG